MATLAELQDALQNAHAAGDVDAARQLADAIVQRQQYPTPSQRRGEDPAERMLRAGPQSNPIPQVLGNIARGGVDVLGGGAQLLSRGANALGIVPESNPGGFLAGPKDVEAQNAQARQNIDQALGPQQPGLLNTVTRAGAGGLLTMPLTPIKAMQAPSLLTRTIGSGVSGGEAAALQDIPNVQSTPDFFKKKALNIAGGVAMGAVAQPIAEKVVSSVVAGLNYGANKGEAITRNLTGANSMDQLVRMTRSALSSNGIDYDTLSENAKQKLLGDVQQALQSSAAVSPGAVARQAAFRQEGFDPLRPWISRDPADFTAVENLSRTPGVGDALMQRKADLDQHVADRLNQMRGPSTPPQTAGEGAITDLKDYLAQAEGKANVLYRTFREIAPNVRGEPQRFVNDLFDSLEGEMALKSLPTGLTSIVNGISEGKIPLTPSTLYQIQKMANASYKGADGSTQFALGHLSAAVDRELGRISDSIKGLDRSMPVVPGSDVPNKEAGYAADVLKQARGQFAQTQRELEGSPILSAAANDAIKPEGFVQNLLSDSASLKDTAATWGKLSDETKSAVRSQVVDALKQKAFGNATDSAGKPAAQATFVNYVNDPVVSQKLKVILGDEGYQGIKRLGVMLEAAKMQPSGSAVNNSNSAGALVGTVLRLGQGMKDLGIYGGGPIAGIAQKSLVQNAQAVPAETLGARSAVIDPYMEEILKRRLGNFAGLLGGAASPDVRKGLLGQSP